MSQKKSDSLIDQIVVQVLAQLRERSGSVKTPFSGSPQTESHAAASSQPRIVVLTDAVITEESLKSLTVDGGSVRISPKAILTPSARDYIRSHGILINRDSANAGSNSTALGVMPGLLIATHLSEVVQSFIEEVKRRWNTLWKTEINAGVPQVVSQSISAICRGEAKQILVLAKTPHQVSCSVNRNEKCRAAVVRSADDVRGVREEMQANVLCVELKQATYHGLRSLLKACTETSSLVKDKEGSRA